MKVVAVDERSDSEWERRRPTVRAYFWTHHRSHVDCMDVYEATFPEAESWAVEEAARRGAELDLAVRATEMSGPEPIPGLIWIRGDGAAAEH